MALRLSKCITHGWIDNRGEGTVKGELWIKDREHPIVLELDGNCLRDIAGCRVTITNPNPADEKLMDELSREQLGWTGDMTASRKVRLDVPETYKGMPLHSANSYRKEREPGAPTPMGNCVYLEWYSRKNGRVVIETLDFEVQIEEGPVWIMSEEEDLEQRQDNLSAFANFIKEMESALGEQDFSEEANPTTDEHEWERFMRKADKRTDKYGKLLEKYMDHPDCERIIAREMGWDRIDDALDADERGLFDDQRAEMDIDWDNFEEPEPNPLTEGTDWIRTKDGRLVHPLQNRVFEFGSKLWHRFKERGLLGGENTDEKVMDMVFQVQCLGAKLAGALNGLARDTDVDTGFVVACLKRTMPFINDGLSVAEVVNSKGMLTPGELDEYCAELLSVRSEIVDLMQDFRER